MNNAVSFKFKEIEKLENDSKYKVTIEFPLETGWINYVNLVIETENTSYTIPLKHLKNENNKIIFETEFYLETRAIYHYYFEYNVNNQIKYIKKQNNQDEHIIKDDMYKEIYKQYPQA